MLADLVSEGRAILEGMEPAPWLGGFTSWVNISEADAEGIVWLRNHAPVLLDAAETRAREAERGCSFGLDSNYLPSDNVCALAAAAEARCVALQSQVETLRGALEWYATDRLYRGHDPDVLYDVGSRARAALDGIDQGDEK